MRLREFLFAIVLFLGFSSHSNAQQAGQPPHQAVIDKLSALSKLPSSAALSFAFTLSGDSPPTSAPLNRAELAARARAELLHSWRAYEQYAWGHDELRPISKTPRDWYGESLCMTPVDALDTLILMGLSDEAEKAKGLTLERLSFDKDISVKNFEITIRILGCFRLTS